jgi:hypothetical protein
MDCEPLDLPGLDEACRAALTRDYAEGLRQFLDARHDEHGWFRLLREIPQTSSARRRLAVLTAEAERRFSVPPATILRYGILQACRVALPRIAQTPVDDSIKQQFIETFLRIAMQPERVARLLDPHREPFNEIARIVTLRRFHAGQSSFDIMALPRTWLLKVHPLALPGLLAEIVGGMGGLGPIVMPHLNYWRDKPMLMLQQENERAMWRIARSIELQPQIRGLVASSWLYSIEVGRVSPHLAWVRDFYLENGAYLVDMERAAERSGFLIGSEARRRLYQEGKFRPRETLVLWRRQDILAWARGRPETQGGEPQRAARSVVCTPAWRHDANRVFSSGQHTILNCERLITFRPRRYWLIVFLLPCLVIGGGVGLAAGWFAVPPVLAAACIAIWLLQYFFLQ